MGIALFFLLRSMIRKLKKVPGSFDPTRRRSSACRRAVAADEQRRRCQPDGDPSQRRCRSGAGAGLVDERSG